MIYRRYVGGVFDTGYVNPPLGSYSKSQKHTVKSLIRVVLRANERPDQSNHGGEA